MFEIVRVYVTGWPGTTTSSASFVALVIASTGSTIVFTTLASIDPRSQLKLAELLRGGVAAVLPTVLVTVATMVRTTVSSPAAFVYGSGKVSDAVEAVFATTNPPGSPPPLSV
ncbi:MAG: hypothetical protein OEW42_19805, partial [Acidimicrobiia bacterium]|nr:hypothetical protein [Acidimicrobiia bacterium]